ncbi:unnamed protein product (macronuclear) [Paramecium tetraurelia]|uniref:Uncharacterized protein n=1 Tax=Paramecium tetraurelia TaxID=5888 RepID=A0DKJ5_PARTE|nr:uncharacterized protein GSPATT00017892001 [Paramecium tetraurelia]CAK83562.1 unnamed protein product [Paramecium tetraurelia]|eukprot:XP_001450959.1 hypothetical protein (macronuclear) [Paramecium tetraurelia strain d4-2]
MDQQESTRSINKSQISIDISIGTSRYQDKFQPQLIHIINTNHIQKNKWDSQDQSSVYEKWHEDIAHDMQMRQTRVTLKKASNYYTASQFPQDRIRMQEASTQQETRFDQIQVDFQRSVENIHQHPKIPIIIQPVSFGNSQN